MCSQIKRVYMFVYILCTKFISVLDFWGTDTDEQACVPLTQEWAKLHQELLSWFMFKCSTFSELCVDLNVIEVMINQSQKLLVRALKLLIREKLS